MKTAGHIGVFLKEHRKLTGAAILTVIFILTLIQNFWTQFQSDDWSYLFVYNHALSAFPDENSKRVVNIIDVIKSMYHHWHVSNGRVVAHGMLQLVLATSYPASHKFVFNIINSVMYMLFGIVIYKHAVYKRQRSLLLLFGIYVMIWFFMPQYGMTVLWASAAANYLWGTVIILAYLLPFRRYASNNGETLKDSIGNAILMGMLGIFAGCINENGGGAAFIVCVAFMILYKIRGIKVPKWSFTGIVGIATGTIILVSAPMNAPHASNYNWSELIKRLNDVKNTTLNLLWVPCIITVICLILAYISNINEKKNDFVQEKTRLYIFAAYTVAAIASFIVLILAWMRPGRGWSIGMGLIMTAISCLAANINFKKLPKLTAPIIALVITVIFSISTYKELSLLHTNYIFSNEQHTEIMEAVKNGEKTANINVNRDKIHGKCCVLDTKYGVLSLENSWCRAWAAKYYGLDSITVNK